MAERHGNAAANSRAPRSQVRRTVGREDSGWANEATTYDLRRRRVDNGGPTAPRMAEDVAIEWQVYMRSNERARRAYAGQDTRTRCSECGGRLHPAAAVP